jgi:tetratricopeptide (TPR) repeat protein
VKQSGTFCAPWVVLVLVAVFGVGCTSFWTSVREGERSRAVKQANSYFKEGRCDRVLAQLERAEAALNLGPYGAHATYQRAVCLENLGFREPARANYWMVVDFYPDSPLKSKALEKLGLHEESESLSELQRESASLLVYPQIEIPSPHYSEAAERSRVVGSCVLSFTMKADETVSDIRVLQMDHPLLASWSIEAVSAAKIREGSEPPDLPVTTVTKLVFSSFWHGETQEAPAKVR